MNRNLTTLINTQIVPKIFQHIQIYYIYTLCSRHIHTLCRISKRFASILSSLGCTNPMPPIIHATIAISPSSLPSSTTIASNSQTTITSYLRRDIRVYTYVDATTTRIDFRNFLIKYDTVRVVCVCVCVRAWEHQRGDKSQRRRREWVVASCASKARARTRYAMGCGVVVRWWV